MSTRILFIILAFVIGNSAFAQKVDETLFTIGNTSISVSEFEYIYEKNNGANANFSEASLKEYLDLYANFKMKVQRAKDVQLDTITDLKKELAGYRQQLSRNYLTDREIMSKLTKEAYSRMETDVNISHIYVKAGKDATAADTLKAYRKINTLYKELKYGKRFSTLAKAASEDESTKEDGGQIGYITGLQLPGFYELETAAYNTPEGTYSKPIRTRIGYHIIRVEDVRPARGRIEVAHILVRVVDKAAEEAKAQQKINRLYRELQGGSKLEGLAKLESEDERTADKGGYIGYITIGQYESTFEEAVFGIADDGQYSRPFRSSVGWHIVKRISHPGLESYEDMKGRLQNRIRRDNRFEIVQASLIDNIKEEGNFKIVDNVYNDFMNGLDATFSTYQWNPPVNNSGKPLFSLGGKRYTLGDFSTYLKRMAGNRVKFSKDKTPQQAGLDMFNDFVKQEALKYEESMLEEKYPEFKALMREYREGIMLFEITKREVWDKASQDTIGLQRFYDNNKSNYKYGERAKVVIYSVNTEDEKALAKFQKLARKKSPEKVLKKMNKVREVVTFETGTYEKGKSQMVDATLWKNGMLGSEWKEGDTRKYVKVNKVMPESIKPLSESRGYVIADYQDFLEKNWIKDLTASYPLKVNEAAFRKLIK
jgi:peptidyl-prolyl cis-trans isomerase SurA